MCKLKSAIAFKDRIFMPDYDSHSRMLEELGIKDDYLGASKKFVRVELSPADGDVFSDIDGWELTVDQDIRPEWFSEDECKAKMIEAVKEWAKTYLHIGIDGLKITSGENHVIKDCKNVEISGSATVENICGSATVKNICGSATVERICDSATVKNICGSATVKNICGSATVERICDSATVISHPFIRWNGANNLIISDNATFKDNYNKKIYQSGDFKLISVESGKKIGDMRE
nr:MAG TPA: hypothetical protein [Caudoviricetes sp.]